MVDGIPYARAGRDELRAEVAGLLAHGEVNRARVALLADADDWWTEPPPPPEQLTRVPAARTLREAMDLLGMGRVADYFAHRWSDPTHLAGLALLQQHWPGGRPVVDVACGTGTHLRELARRGCTDLVGVDVVWAKLCWPGASSAPRRATSAPTWPASPIWACRRRPTCCATTPSTSCATSRPPPRRYASSPGTAAPSSSGTRTSPTRTGSR